MFLLLQRPCFRRISWRLPSSQEHYPPQGCLSPTCQHAEQQPAEQAKQPHTHPPLFPCGVFPLVQLCHFTHLRVILGLKYFLQPHYSLHKDRVVPIYIPSSHTFQKAANQNLSSRKITECGFLMKVMGEGSHYTSLGLFIDRQTDRLQK